MADTQSLAGVPYRPLGLVKQVLEELGEEISYFYDDLVFAAHNIYLLQFGEKGKDLYFIENDEATDDELGGRFEFMAEKFKGYGISLQHRGRYKVSEGEDEQLQLQFLPPEEGE